MSGSHGVLHRELAFALPAESGGNARVRQDDAPRDAFSQLLRGAAARHTRVAFSVSGAGARPAQTAPQVRGLEELVACLLLDDPAVPPRPPQAVHRELQDACSVSEAACASVWERVLARVRRCVERYLDTHLGKQAAPDACATAAWVEQLWSSWEAFQTRLAVLHRLLLPLLGSVWYATHAATPLEELCFAHMRKQVLQVLRAESRLVQGIEAQVHAVRAQEANDAPLRGSVALAERMGLGPRVDEALVEQTHEYYGDVAARLFAPEQRAQLEQGILHIAAAVDAERARSTWLYTERAPQEEAMCATYAQLVERHAAELLAVVPALLSASAEKPLHALYRLCQEADAHADASARGDAPTFQTQLHDAVLRNVRERGMQIVQDREHDGEMVERLLAFQRQVRHVLAECFERNEALTHGLRDTFEAFINTRENKPAELLAKYLDGVQRAGNRAMSDEQLEATMDDVLTLFRYTHDKDMFEEFYKRCFAKRLLLNRSASSDAERAMLVKLKEECGPDFTAKLETMLKDVEVSEDLMGAFAGQHAAEAQPFDFEVCVLTHAHWPTFPDAHVELPESLLQAQRRFERFYATCHSGRSLTWKNALGHMILVANLGRTGVRELHISTFQAAVLLLFNEVAGNEPLSYTHIQQRTGLEPVTLKRTLQSLACGAIPTRVLRKHPQGRDVDDSDSFTVNEALKNERRRIRINQIQMKDTPEEQKTTEQRVFLDREIILQAAAMRVLKARKTIRHAELQTEVVNQIRNRFAVEASELKKAFERLIEKDLMERVEGERGLYRYVA